MMPLERIMLTGRQESKISRRQKEVLACRAKRSEEHTSELQSRLHLVCRLLLEKKNGRAAKLDGRDELQRVRTRDRLRPAEMLAHPRDAAAIVEPHDQLGAHRHPALVAPDHADA